REQYRTLVESTQAIPWETTPGTLRFGYVRPQADALLGRPLADWRDEEFLAHALHPDDERRGMAWFERLGEARADAEIELCLVAASGRAGLGRLLVERCARH